MGIGASLFLIAIGAIFTFGVDADTLGVLNIDMIGRILMLIGLAALAMTFYFWTTRRRRLMATQQVVVDPQPVVQVPVAQQPVAQQPVVQQPMAAQRPVEPAVQQPVAQDPMVQRQVVESRPPVGRATIREDHTYRDGDGT